MKKIYAFSDTETTGTSYTQDQILDYAIVFMEKHNILESVNKEILVKKNTVPNPKALLVNNLNPFSKEYLDKAISEYEAVNLITNQIQKYSLDKTVGSVLFMFYNAPFDVQMLQSAFKKCGKNFNAVVPVVFDLYILAKHLIDKGVVKTKMGDYGPSGKLGDVYEALGFSKASMNAHNALGDTIILPAVANKLYMLFNGKEISDIDIDPSNFQENSIQSIVYLAPLSFARNRELQLSNKTIIVVKNDIENKKIYAIDSSKTGSMVDNLDKVIEVIEYAQIFDESLIDIPKNKACLKYINENQNQIKQYLNNFKQKEKEVLLYSNSLKIEQLADKLLLLKKDNKLSKDIIDNLNEDEKSLLKDAEEFSYSRYNEGWSSDLYGKYYKDSIKTLFEVDKFKILHDPVEGVFLLENIENKSERSKATTKSVILKELVELGFIENKSETFKLINNILSSIESMKNEKSLDNILKEFNLEKVETFNGANKNHKEILSSLLDFLKEQYPEKFKDVQVPNFKLNLANFKKKG